MPASDIPKKQGYLLFKNDKIEAFLNDYSVCKTRSHSANLFVAFYHILVVDIPVARVVIGFGVAAHS